MYSHWYDGRSRFMTYREFQSLPRIIKDKVLVQMDSYAVYQQGRIMVTDFLNHVCTRARSADGQFLEVPTHGTGRTGVSTVTRSP